MTTRYDVLHIDRSNIRIDSNGFMTVPAVLTKTGVYKYFRADGSIVNELRHPADVLAPASVSTAKRLPVVDEHPAVGKVTPQNVKQLSAGFSGDDVIVNDSEVQASLTITDATLIDKIMNGKTDISMGYVADVIPESGEFNGQRYDARQTNVRYNHVAVVDSARVKGSRLRLDSVDCAMSCELQKNMYGDINPEGTMSTKKVKLPKIEIGAIRRDEAEIVLPAEEAKVVEANEVTFEQLVKLVGSLQASVEELKGQLAASESAKADAEKAAAEAADPAKLEKMAEERADALTVAKTIGVEVKPGTPLDGIRRAVIEKATPKIRLDSATSDFVRGLYAGVVADIERRKAGADSVARLGELTQPRFDSNAANVQAPVQTPAEARYFPQSKTDGK